MANATLNPAEEAQLKQTIEMFEVIVQSQPNDCQSLEILKEAYTKLGREPDVIRISKRIAEAYTQMGQLSSAILEYETVLQRQPNDVDVQTALRQIEDQASNSASQSAAAEPAALAPQAETDRFHKKTHAAQEELTTAARRCTRFLSRARSSAPAISTCAGARRIWPGRRPDVAEPFIQMLGDKGLFPVEKSLKLLADKSRAAFLPFDRYDVDMDLLRGFPAEVCRRWCVAPFDRMSKSILVATANPFNQQAAKELAEATSYRLLWYLTTPAELVQIIRKAFR